MAKCVGSPSSSLSIAVQCKLVILLIIILAAMVALTSLNMPGYAARGVPHTGWETGMQTVPLTFFHPHPQSRTWHAV